MIGRNARITITRRAGLSSVSLGRPSASSAPSRNLSLASFSSTENDPHRQWSNNDPSKSLGAAGISLRRCPPPFLPQPLQNHALIQAASFSSTTASSAKDAEEGSSGIRGWMNDRQARQEQEKYMEQMTRLSTMEVFSMERYREELQSGVDGGGVMTKLSFLQTKEIKQAKEVIEVVDKIIEVVGPDATAEDLLQLDRLQRLRVATAANKTLEEIAIMVSQITNMDVMQKTLRKRYLEGKPIPPDKDAMQAVIQKDAMSVLSKSQKEMMKTRQESNARRMARRRR